MAAALRAHPLAGKLLDPDRGTPEQSLFWTDERTGVWRRARLDALPHPAAGRMIIADYKTCDSAKPRACAKSIANYGYNMQGAAYMRRRQDPRPGRRRRVPARLPGDQTPPVPDQRRRNDGQRRCASAHERNAARDRHLQALHRNQPLARYSEGIELLDLPLWAERARGRRWLS
jgi:hypothetical protein